MIRKTLYNDILKILAICCLLTSVCLPAVQAQNSSDYFLANQLLQQQKYEQAYTVFERLVKQHPSSYVFFEKATECLINLKRYDEAVSLARQATSRDEYSQQAKIKLGEIYHVKGDTTQAFQTWSSVKSNNPQNYQLYLSLARAMENQRAFNQAIEIYQEAKQKFSGSPNLSIELANTYMQAGKYEQSVREYLDLLKENPDRISFVQSTMLRFNDDYMYDIAILEIGDFLNELSPQHPSHNSLHQLELWLLMERGLYQRAFNTAKNYEDSHNRVSYSLYSLGGRLLSEQKFDLARQAYSYYIENNVHSAKPRSMHELAEVNIAWADYLADYNLANASKRDSLYQRAHEILEVLISATPNYSDRYEAIVTQSELALDHLHNPNKAQENLETLQVSTDSSIIAQRTYIKGRIYLYEKDYSRARVAFTKSNKIARVGDLAEKTRYFLALTDFFSGDLEFAKIQLNALERQSTSYFANDAVKLRVWIQDGLQADSTGADIVPFANAIEAFSQGHDEKAFEYMSSVLNFDSFHPLMDEALLELSGYASPNKASLLYKLITHFVKNNGQFSPLKERLMWEKARIADEIVTNSIAVPRNSVSDSAFANITQSISLPETSKEIITLYEEILLQYPNGFYADFARSRINELQNPSI